LSPRALACALGVLLAGAFATAEVAAQPAAVGVAVAYAGQPVAPAQFNGDLGKLPLARGNAKAAALRPYRARPPRPITVPRTPGIAAAPSVAPPAGPLAAMPGPLQSFAGLSFNDSCPGGRCGGGWPPDPNGDVGPNHYVLAVNDAIGIYSKTGTLLAAFTENSLWSSSGSNPCNGASSGDPVVLYDWLADRWVLTWLAFRGASGPFYECIAASKTGDPVAGGWWLYPIRVDDGIIVPAGSLNDYPKFGLWHDCLYMGANAYQNLGAYTGALFASFSRADLYAGNALTYAIGYLPYPANSVFSMFPASNLGTGARAVQPGTPAYFVMESLTDWAYDVRAFTPGPNCGAGGTLGAPVAVSQASYTPQYGAIVPQKSTPNKLDMIDDRIMQKVWYRRIGSSESLWVTHPVRNPGGSNTAMQWAQIDVTGGAIATTPVQEQIFAPDSTLYRFMGSLAVDGQGNMALGYSVANGSTYPGIRYAGRLAGDPTGTLPQSETALIAGGGSQTNNCGGGPCDRWGDYTSMSVDPRDDCTFWYTNEYYDTPANGSAGNWHTRIGAFKFPSCQSLGPTTTTLASSVNPSLAGTSVAFTAQVSGASPSGSVAFADGGNAITGCSAVPLTGGGNTPTAQCATSSLAFGAHPLTATYGGDTNNAGSAGDLVQVVNATTTLTIKIVNKGPSEVAAAPVTDPAPQGLTLGSWTCAVTAAGDPGTVTTACGATSGSGPLDTTATLRVNGEVTYTIAATVAGTGASGSNVATIAPPPGTVNPGTSCTSGGGATRSFDPATGACSTIQPITVP
jgi:uncharacterized repeat protein (TIGR01451 family)